MSQERRRRRAQQRTQGRQHSTTKAATAGTAAAKQRHEPAKPGRTALQRRKHNLIVLLGIIVIAVNVLALFVTTNWDHRLLVLVLSLVGATVAYFLAADPARSTGV
jgi:hypothetical protein